MGPVNIEHNNGDDNVDDGQDDNHDIYHGHVLNQGDDSDYITITLIHSYGNNFQLDHLQVVDMSKGIDRGGDYANDDNINDNGDEHIDLEEALRII